MLLNCGIYSSLYFTSVSWSKIKTKKQTVSLWRSSGAFIIYINMFFGHNAHSYFIFWLIVSSFDWELLIFQRYVKLIDKAFLKGTDNVWQFNSRYYNLLRRIPVQLEDVPSVTLTCAFGSMRSNSLKPCEYCLLLWLAVSLAKIMSTCPCTSFTSIITCYR